MSFSVAIYIEIKAMTLLRLTGAGCSTAKKSTAAGGRSREISEVPKQGAWQTGVKPGDHVSNGEGRWFKSNTRSHEKGHTHLCMPFSYILELTLTNDPFIVNSRKRLFNNKAKLL